MSKSYLYLVSTPAIKKKYDMFYVYMCDESVFEYKLDEIKVILVDEWVQVERLDKTVMESFMGNNILRVKFVKSIAKEVPNEHKVPDLQPVA